MARGTQVTFGQVFAVREFRALWAAEGLSQAGDQLARVALAILVYQRTGSAALTGLTYALTLAPSFLGGIALAGLADRHPRRDVMVASDLARAALIGLVAVPGLPFGAICVLVAGVSFVQAPFKAAQMALLPDVLEGDHFVVGMGIRTITMQSAQLLGFAGGGVIVGLVNPYLGLALDAVTFVGSAAFVRFGVRHRPAATSPADRPSFATSLRAGLRLMFRDRTLRVLLTFGWLASILIVYEGLAAPYAAEIGGSDVGVGLILAADPLGSVIGAFLFSRFVTPPTRLRLLGPLAILNCLVLVPCLTKPDLAVSIGLFVLAGAVGTAVFMQSSASFSRAVPDENRGQALGLNQSVVATIQGVCPLLAGLLADQIGTAHAVGAVGLVGLAVAIPAATTWPRTMAALPTPTGAPAAG
jgi:MFS family permease